jgi:hypothetical protein
MKNPTKNVAIEAFLQKHLKKANRFIPARLQAALALLERLRDYPSLVLSEHLSQSGSAGIQGHETFGDKAIARLHLQSINKNHGRRSSNLPGWGQELLNTVAASGFAVASSEARSNIIDEVQQVFAEPLRAIIDENPLEVRLRERTAKAIVKDLLCAAELKGKLGDVAQYLVGAKLALRFGRDIPVYPANKGDRTSHFDAAPRLGDFEIENAVIEVAAGLPDEKHLQQIAEIQEKSDAEVWLLTREDRVETWQRVLENAADVDIERVVVTSVEAFVGQNITELGEFASKGKLDQLRALFALYNTRWVAKVGTPGIRIQAK